MKKIILIITMMLSFIEAGELYAGYQYNQSKLSIEGLVEIETPNFLSDMKNIIVYKDKDSTYLIFRNKQLKYVMITQSNFNLKEKIETLIKNQIRLKKILFMTNKEKIKVNNVRELLNQIKIVKEKATILDSYAQANLLFKKDKLNVVMTYILNVQRDIDNCSTCEELKNGITFKEKEYLRIVFSESDK